MQDDNTFVLYKQQIDEANLVIYKIKFAKDDKVSIDVYSYFLGLIDNLVGVLLDD